MHREHEYYFATVLPEELTQRPRRPAVRVLCCIGCFWSVNTQPHAAVGGVQVLER